MKNCGFSGSPAGRGDMTARLMLVLLCLIWGTTWPLLKIALDEIPPFHMRAASTALGAAALCLIGIVTRRSFRLRTVKAWMHVVIASLLNIVGFTVLSAFAQLAAATSRVAILAYTMSVWSMLLAWIFLRKRASRSQVIALVLCGAGLAVLIYPLAATGVPAGIALALATGLVWSAGTVYLQWAQIGGDPVGLATWQLAIAFVVIGGCMVLFEPGFDFTAVHANTLLALLAAGVFGSGIAYGLWFAVVGRLSAVTASLGVLGSPVVGVVASILMLGERPTAADVVGFALILAACACVLVGRQTLSASPLRDGITVEGI